MVVVRRSRVDRKDRKSLGLLGIKHQRQVPAEDSRYDACVIPCTTYMKIGLQGTQLAESERDLFPQSSVGLASGRLPCFCAIIIIREKQRSLIPALFETPVMVRRFHGVDCLWLPQSQTNRGVIIMLRGFHTIFFNLIVSRCRSLVGGPFVLSGGKKHDWARLDEEVYRIQAVETRKDKVRKCGLFSALRRSSMVAFGGVIDDHQLE